MFILIYIHQWNPRWQTEESLAMFPVEIAMKFASEYLICKTEYSVQMTDTYVYNGIIMHIYIGEILQYGKQHAKNMLKKF